LNNQKIQFKEAIELQKYNHSRDIQDQELRIKYDNYNQKIIHTNNKNDLQLRYKDEMERIKYNNLEDKHKQMIYTNDIKQQQKLINAMKRIDKG
jgi:hypothetical protein